MAQEQDNISTMHQLPEAEKISGSDLLYLVQGEGSDRDKKATLGEIVEAVGNKVKVDASDKYASYLLGKLEEDITGTGATIPTNGDIGFKTFNERDAKLLKGVIQKNKITHDMLNSSFKVQNSDFVNNTINAEKLADISIKNRKLGYGCVRNDNIKFDVISVSELDTTPLYNRMPDPIDTSGTDIATESVGRIIVVRNDTSRAELVYYCGTCAQYEKAVRLRPDYSMMFLFVGKDPKDNRRYIWSPLTPFNGTSFD